RDLIVTGVQTCALPILRRVYQRARELGVGVGGPDLLPYKPGQMSHSYPLIRECAGKVPTGIAVQDGNYQHKNPKSGQLITIAERSEERRVGKEGRSGLE